MSDFEKIDEEQDGNINVPSTHMQFNKKKKKNKKSKNNSGMQTPLLTDDKFEK